MCFSDGTGLPAVTRPSSGVGMARCSWRSSMARDRLRPRRKYLARSRRLAYHLHDVGARKLVPHAHCGAATALTDAEGAHHLRAVELDLREAHREFMTLWASDTAPDCAHFLPLEIVRDV